MIKVSFISPTSLVGQYGNQGDFHLALAHLIDSIDQPPNQYEQALIDSKLPIYLDNGLFENHQSVPVDQLIAKAAHLNAVYVFAPDVLYDRVQTEKNIGTAHEILTAIKQDIPQCQTKLAAVVQANNPNDYVDSYLKMAQDDRIDLIGLSILSIPKSFQSLTETDDIAANRIRCLRALESLPIKKDSHLLGLGSSYRDVDFAREHCPWVVSHDSSSAIWNGIWHKNIDSLTFDVYGGKIEVPVDFDFDRPLTNEQNKIIQHNIDVVKKIVK